MIGILNSKKITLISYILIIIYTAFLLGTFCAVYANASEFSDIKGHWAEKYLTDLIDKGYLKGVKSGSQMLIQPGRNITRAEFVTILMRTGNYQVNLNNVISFSDVKAKDWYKESIDKAVSNSISGGYPDGTFRPNSPITRAEIASLIARIGKFDTANPGSSTSFTDVPKDKWYFSSVISAQKKGIINGYPDGSFKPEGKATRAEVAVIVSNYLKLADTNVTPVLSTPAATEANPAATEGVVIMPTIEIPGAIPYVTPPPELSDPVKTVPNIFGLDLWSSNETELLYNINYSDLNDLGKFSFKISYDPSKVVASNVYESSMKGSGYLNQNGSIDLSSANTGEITISSNDISQISSDSGTLLFVKFSVMPGASGKTDINIKGISSDTPEFYKSNGDKIDFVNIKNGSITFE